MKDEVLWCRTPTFRKSLLPSSAWSLFLDCGVPIYLPIDMTSFRKQLLPS